MKNQKKKDVVVELVDRGAKAIRELVREHGLEESSPEAMAKVVLVSAGVLKEGEYERAVSGVWKKAGRVWIEVKSVEKAVG